MSNKSFVRDSDGNITHVRETIDDGRTSRLYEYDDTLLGHILHDDKGECVEVAVHDPNGTTTAHEHDGSFIGEVFHGGRGEEK